MISVYIYGIVGGQTSPHAILHSNTEEEEVAVRELHAWQRATSSLENMEPTPEEARRDWMDVVNSKFCTYYLLDF